jgi:hypothetical protein
MVAGVKQLVLFHHDPDHSDAFLDAVGNAVQERIAGSTPSIACQMAREGALVSICVKP